MSGKSAKRPRGISKNSHKKAAARAKSWNLSIYLTIPLIVVFIAAILGGMSFLSGGIAKGAEAMFSSYKAAYGAERDTAYQSFYQNAFNKAEQKYHVSNMVAISIGNLQETQKLEVLRASDIEIITESGNDNSGHVTAWLEVTGEGVFTIDLQAAEFSLDNSRRYVLVRVPEPELENIAITRTEKKLFEDDFANGSYSEGVELALKQQNEAKLRIQRALMSNQYIFENAKKVAVSTIQNLVKQFNPDIPDIIVEVEFM